MTAKVISLGYEPREWQRKCHMSKTRFTVLALHRRAGKTELAVMELLDKALRCTQELGMYFYVAPFLKQAKTLAWERLKARCEQLRITGAADVQESELSVRFKHNGATVRIFGADNPDAMRGVRLDGVVLDEVSQIKPETWEDILRPALSDRKGWSIFIGTPNGVNLFSQLFYKAQSAEDGWSSARYTVYDTDALDPDEVEQARRDMSEVSFAREYLCDFSASGDNQLVSLSDCENASRRVHDVNGYFFAPRVLGVDPARFGDDRSVIFARQGIVAFEPQAFRGLDNMALAGKVAQKIEDWAPDAVFIDAGAGSGVIDRLRQLGHDVIEVDFGGKPTDARFVNKRAEMWYAVKDWLAAGGAIPNIATLKLELATPTYSFDAANRIKLESKDEIKKRLAGGASPDLADALALTFAYPVAPRRERVVLPIERKRNGPGRDWDPYNAMR